MSTHGSILRLVQFNILINDLQKATQYPLIKFADDSKLGDTVNMLQGRATILRDLGRPEKQAIRKGLLLKRTCGSWWTLG